ncbi:TPA: hypothetical protein ACTXW4_003568 [Legionella anisa]
MSLVHKHVYDILTLLRRLKAFLSNIHNHFDYKKSLGDYYLVELCVEAVLVEQIVVGEP